MEYLFVFVVSIIAVIIVAISQSKAVSKLEKEKLAHTLDSLYSHPNSAEKHQEFIQNLRILDKHIGRYRSDGYSYSPSDLIIKKLLMHIATYPHDNLAHERFIELISRAKKLTSEYLFKQLLHQVKMNLNARSSERFAVCASKAQFLSLNLLDSLLDYLDRDPLNPAVQQHFWHCITNIMLLPDIQRERIYDKTLQTFENNPKSSTAKQFVLTVGRWHLGKLRKDGCLTIYDEQRIQNDILARTV